MSVVPFRKDDIWNAQTREQLSSGYREAIVDHIRAHTVGTNINHATLLTTDYLNHFNEVVMLLEMLPSAPGELAADLAAWRPVSYEDHFDESGFRDKALALAAYEKAPAEIREAFDLAVADLDQEMVLALQEVQQAVDSGDVMSLQTMCEHWVPELQNTIQSVASIVNGHLGTPSETQSAEEPCENAQDAVDALFD